MALGGCLDLRIQSKLLGLSAVSWRTLRGVGKFAMRGRNAGVEVGKISMYVGTNLRFCKEIRRDNFMLCLQWAACWRYALLMRRCR